jgi:hypothetical protein
MYLSMKLINTSLVAHIKLDMGTHSDKGIASPVKEASKDDEYGAASPARPVGSAQAESSTSKAPLSSQCIFPL